MRIDVIIPAYRAASTIGDCVGAAVADGFGRDAIIVVDDGSDDGTASAARAAGATCIVTDGNTGAAAARNRGAAAGRGEIILFVDADVVMAAGTRAAVADIFTRSPDIAAAFGAYDATPRAPGVVSRFRNILHRHVHLQGAGDVALFWTGLGAIRRADFDGLGGFDEGQRMMEDIQLGMTLARRGRRIVLTPRLQGTHLKRWTLRSMVRTDTLDRAIPWGRLLRAEGGALPDTLNVGPIGRTSVLLVLATLLCAPLALLSPGAAAAVALACLGALAWVNRAFLTRLRREQGAGLALAGVPLLWVHYLCGGVGYAWVLATPRRGR